MFTEGSVDSKRIVYTPSPFAKASLLYLQETGTLKALKPHTSTRSRLASYLFFIVLDGRGILEYGGKRISLSPGDCVFIDCMEPYSHITANDLWKLQWVHFNGESMPEIYEKYQERGGQPVFRPQNAASYTDILDSIFSISSSEDYLRDMKINEQLSSLLTKIMEMSWIPEAQMKRGSGREYSLQDIKMYLDENWQKKIALDKLAEMFFINKYYLARLFKNQYGSSILNYVMDQRITQAKKMLRFTDKQIEVVGRDCGFDDANYFTRMFKKVEGSSPSEYRKLWKQ